MRCIGTCTVSLVAAIAANTAALPAQGITQEARTHRGRLVMGTDQGTMDRIGAGGAAHYRAHLAVASRLLEILKRDSAVVAPIGYDMHLSCNAGPSDSFFRRSFPSSFGVGGVLLYYYHDARSTAPHGLEVSEEGPGFDVRVNDPSCLLDSRLSSDADGPIFLASPRSEDYRGHPSYGQFGECIVVTRSARALVVPVSRERLLQALIGEARATYDSAHADARQLRSQFSDSAAASEYQDWLAQRAARDSMAQAIYQTMKKQNPAQAEAYLHNLQAGDSAAEAAFRKRMSATTNPVDEASAGEGARIDAVAMSRINAMEAELRNLSTAERKAPAYIDLRETGTGSGLVARDAPGAVAVVRPNPAFRDRSLPDSSPQVITVLVRCRKIHGEAVGSGCDETGQRMNDYERILSHLDWAALQALLAPPR